jgi:hypothetical protein
LFSDSHCEVKGLTFEDLQRFENVREITGYLAFEGMPTNGKDLCAFRNLRRIRGKVLKDNMFSLMVYTVSPSLRELCFNSLERIDKGDVYIHSNKYLCTSKIKRALLRMLKDSKEQRVIHDKNGKKCNMSDPCHSSCDDSKGCWGPNPTQCIKCLHYSDSTNEDGLYTKAWITDTLPGYNVTTCVKQCDTSKGVFAHEESKECRPCHEECYATCDGPAASDCTSIPDKETGELRLCKNFRLVNNDTCVDACPDSYYKEDKTCLACSSNCVGLSFM